MAALNNNSVHVLHFLLAACVVLLCLIAWTFLYDLEVTVRFIKTFNCSSDVMLGRWSEDNVEGDFDEEWTDEDGEHNQKRRINFLEEFAVLIIPKNILCRKSAQVKNIPSIFVVIKSRPYEHFQRMAIRQTYGRLLNRRIIFAVGHYFKEPGVDNDVDLEAEKFGDILKLNFSDTYRNLGFKSMAILRWIGKNCPFEPFYLQADSDAVLYPKNLLAFARQKIGTKRTIYGHCWRNAPVLRRGKWRVSMFAYAGSHYPEYCSGAAYLMTGDVPGALLRAIEDPKSAEPGLYYQNPRIKFRDIKSGMDAGRGNIKNYAGNSGQFEMANSPANELEATAIRLSRMSTLAEPYISIDDAYFTGLLAEQALINRVNHDGFIFWKEFRRTYKTKVAASYNCPFRYREFLASFEHKSPDDMRRAWSDYQRNEAHC